MQIYVELALIENFCMDFSLLFIAKAATKNPARYFRLGTRKRKQPNATLQVETGRIIPDDWQ